MATMAFSIFILLFNFILIVGCSYCLEQISIVVGLLFFCITTIFLYKIMIVRMGSSTDHSITGVKFRRRD